jgi:hypothetical protein
MTRLACALVTTALILAAPAAHAAGAQQQEQNKEGVVGSYEKGLNLRDFEAASKYFAARRALTPPRVVPYSRVRRHP